MSLFSNDEDNKKTIWEVTTEGDIEGKSIKTLGYFQGNIVDIAAKLQGLETYGLHFTRLELAQFPILSTYQANKESVVISVNGYKKDELEQLALKNGIKTKPCSIYNSITIHLDKDMIMRDKKERALAKLTDEEKNLLGLK